MDGLRRSYHLLATRELKPRRQPACQVNRGTICRPNGFNVTHYLTPPCWAIQEILRLATRRRHVVAEVPMPELVFFNPSRWM